VTINEAKFNLLLDRPGTEDAKDAGIGEALKLARIFPELADWHVAHCAGQMNIRQLFRQIEPPAGLKEQIISEHAAKAGVITSNTYEAPARTWQFTTTRWSMVLTAGGAASLETDTALEQLCRTYWYPLYAFVRRRGYEVFDAQDLTQDFFARLLEKRFLVAVDRSKGKFRSFLLTALEHFLAQEWRRSRTQKRGGRFTFASLDDGSAETQYQQIPGGTLAPDRLYEQQWALTLLEQVLKKLRAEFVAGGAGADFEELKGFLAGERQAGGYAALAVRLNTTQGAVKMTISRMRRRYGELLRAEIARTVSGPDEIEAELRGLFIAVGA